jgi:hypothetical protein
MFCTIVNQNCKYIALQPLKPSKIFKKSCFWVFGSCQFMKLYSQMIEFDLALMVKFLRNYMRLTNGGNQKNIGNDANYS